MRSICFGVFILAFTIQSVAQEFFLGADLSYVNEMEDCGAVYKEAGQENDVYEIFSSQGANLARYRLWHNPDSVNGYSFYQDVERGLARAKASEMQVLLDFHYSDIWADPGRQWRPKKWNDIDDDNILADSVYEYTYQTLLKLHNKNLVPEFVQIGNETNGNILQKITTDDLRESSPNNFPIDWKRQVMLFNHGLSALHAFNEEFSYTVQSVIHIAQPENVEWWFDDAIAAGLSDFDIIGLSYYPQYSDYNVRGVGEAISSFKKKYAKEIMVVEVSYPWFGSNEELETRATSCTPAEQKNFLIELSYLVKENGGMGVVYWEPAWVDTECETLWQTGSSHDRYIFFDSNNDVIPESFEFYNYDYTLRPNGLKTQDVTLAVDMGGQEGVTEVFVTGDFSGENGWNFLPMTKQEGSEIYEYKTQIQGRSVGAYTFYKDDSWNTEYQEKVPEKCAEFWGTHRKYGVMDEKLILQFAWSSCKTVADIVIDKLLSITNDNKTKFYPNPSSGLIYWAKANVKDLIVYSLAGIEIERFVVSNTNQVDLTRLPSGLYLIRFDETESLQQLVIR